MGQTFTARQVAAIVSAARTKTEGHPVKVTDKRVRSWVRDNVTAFDDDKYTAHVYDVRMRDRIVSAMAGATSTSRSKAASSGRTPQTAPKSRKAAPRPASAPVARVAATTVESSGGAA